MFAITLAKFRFKFKFRISSTLSRLLRIQDMATSLRIRIRENNTRIVTNRKFPSEFSTQLKQNLIISSLGSSHYMFKIMRYNVLY